MITHWQREKERVSYCEVKHPSVIARSCSKQHVSLEFHEDIMGLMIPMWASALMLPPSHFQASSSVMCCIYVMYNFTLVPTSLLIVCLLGCFHTWFACQVRTQVGLLPPPPTPSGLCSYYLIWVRTVVRLHHQVSSCYPVAY